MQVQIFDTAEEMDAVYSALTSRTSSPGYVDIAGTERYNNELAQMTYNQGNVVASRVFTDKAITTHVYNEDVRLGGTYSGGQLLTPNIKTQVNIQVKGFSHIQDVHDAVTAANMDQGMIDLIFTDPAILTAFEREMIRYWENYTPTPNVMDAELSQSGFVEEIDDGMVVTEYAYPDDDHYEYTMEDKLILDSSKSYILSILQQGEDPWEAGVTYY